MKKNFIASYCSIETHEDKEVLYIYEYVRVIIKNKIRRDRM